MKQLLISCTVLFLAMNTSFAKLPKATDKEQVTIYTNSFEYTRRGTLGAMDFVVTEVPTTNLVTKGVNIWAQTSDSEGEVDGIWGYGVTYLATGGISIIDPVSGKQVRSSVYNTQNGHSYLCAGTSAAETFTYYAQSNSRIVSNVPFVYGTNSTNTAQCKELSLPNKTSSDDNQAVKQNSKEIIADRAWVIAILKAYRDGKLTINDDGSIVIAP